MGTVAIGDQGTFVVGVELLAEPDGRSQSQQPLDDAGVHPGRGAAAVLLQPQLALEGIR